jgi:hypothetical protein
MPDKSGTSTRDRKKKGGSKSEGFTHFGSPKHVRKVEEIQSRGSNVPVQGTNGHSKDGKGKNKKK